MPSLFEDFFKSERSSGIVLIGCTLISLILANSSAGGFYLDLWHSEVLCKPLDFWINDVLMTFFFLLVGLEIERELYAGELSDLKKSLLPAICAIGGMMVPAAVHLAFNYGTPGQNGFGIPMATDIAFSLAVLSLLGKRIPVSIKIFLTALAIIDDLGAILIIACFYSTGFSLTWFGMALLLYALLFAMNRAKVYRIGLYLLIGSVMWICLYRAGIHPTITGVLVAFIIPFAKKKEDCPSYRLQHLLHRPVAFLILPLFALANTAILFPASVPRLFVTPDSLGIMAGLVIGKPLGIFSFAMAGTALGLCSLPPGLKLRHIFWAGALAGIGFTMSIFISLLAFDDPYAIVQAKMAILIASCMAGFAGYMGLRLSFRRNNKE